jgi:hypothetical protein
LISSSFVVGSAEAEKKYDFQNPGSFASFGYNDERNRLACAARNSMDHVQMVI